jgi:hypothetical protein
MDGRYILKCPCENCLIVGRCRRMVPDEVVKRCDLVCEYLEMKGHLKTITFIDTYLNKKELSRRLSKIIECLKLVENGGCYIGSSPSQETIEKGKLFYNGYKY